MTNNRIELAASEWLAKLDCGAVSDDERAAFESWCNADPRHRGAYARLEAVWHQLNRVQALRAAAPNTVDPDFLANRRSVNVVAEAKALSLRRRFARLGAIAAVLLAAAALGWLVTDRYGDTAYTTAKGSFQRIVLEGGSIIELNTDSKLHVRFTDARRGVELARGEASFEVAHDPARPFVVAAGDTAVRAVGTKFNVRRLERSIEVIVEEGKVAIGASDASTALSSSPVIAAGHAAMRGSEGLKIEPVSAAVAARKLAWQQGMIVFEGEPLAGVVAEFNRYNERQLVLADSKLAALRIGGYFRPTNLDAFVSVLESDFGIRAEQRSGRIALLSDEGTSDEEL